MTMPLPTGWLSLRLGDVVDYGSTEKAEPGEFNDDDWILELEDIERDTSRIVNRQTFASRVSKSSKNKFGAGDILYGKLRPYLNKIVIADGPGFCSTEIVPIKPPPEVVPRYLFYWMKHPTFLRYVESVSHGINMPRLGTEAGKKAPFVLAPLNEQRRIADKLDALFARINSCRVRLQRMPALIKHIRDSLVGFALSGTLTEEWRKKNDYSCWTVKKLIDVIEAKPRNGYSPKAVDYVTKIKTLTLSATTTGKFDATKFKYVDETIGDDSYLWLRDGDILIQRANSIDYVGTAAIYEGQEGVYIYPDLMMRCRVGPMILPRYLWYALSTKSARDYFRLNCTGTAGNMPKINQPVVCNVPIPLPGLDEQSEIVRRLDLILKALGSAEHRANQLLGLLDRLEQSLLTKAFQGELIPQNGSDEPADVLVARITEKCDIEPSKTKKRKKQLVGAMR